MENKENNVFMFKYSAKEQEEIKAIRKKYILPEENEDKMTQLRRLDASVTKKASCIALIFGVIGTLLLGSGMSLFMSDFGEILGSLSYLALPIGIIIGIVGIILVSIAYPIYNLVVKKERERIAPQILRLSEELIK